MQSFRFLGDPFDQSSLVLAAVFWLSLGSLIAQEKKDAPAPRQLSARFAAEPVHLDGLLGEEAWKTAPVANHFVQAEPKQGDLATEQTEVRVLYDRKNLYFGIYCHDSQPDRIIVNDLRRDFDIKETDVFGVSLDTYHDQRNTFNFYTNPGGAMRDEQAFDDGRFLNVNWDGLWQVAARRQPDGWSAEIQIPFRTLRFNPLENQTFGLNFYRNVRRKNEQDYWSPVSRRFALTRASMAGVLSELDGVKSGRSLRVKPSAVAGVKYEKSNAKGDSDFDPHFGVDVKYGLTNTLTLDLTYNPDFSQVEVDTQQINLTRFDLFFPEKREFFLENEGFFHFGDLQGERGPNTQEETRLFYSRRIGLSRSGEPVSLMGGARLSGRLGHYTLGLLNIQQEKTDRTPAHNFGVVRARRDLFANSDVGVMFINRQSSASGDYNRAFGIDGNFQFKQRLTLNAYASKTDSPGRHGEDMARKFAVKWKDNLLDAGFVFTDIEKNFNPEVGFVLRTDFRQYRGSLTMLPRPKANRYVREFEPHAIVRYSTDQSGRLVARDDHYGLYVNFHDGSRFEVNANHYFERLDKPFNIRSTVTIPKGDYSFSEFGIVYNSNRSAILSATINLKSGQFYDGTKRSASLGVYAINGPHLTAGLTYNHNNIHLLGRSRFIGAGGNFKTHLAGLNVNYSFNARTFASAFIQYNSSSGRWITNLRFRLIHRPLSDIYLVYSEDNPIDALARHSRGFFIKYTHVLEF